LRNVLQLCATAFLASAVFITPAAAATDIATLDSAALPCLTGKNQLAKSGDGKTRLAMIVGVSTYAANRTLEGAALDAKRIYAFLADMPNRYFPKQNICVLTDSEGTYAGFRDAFRKALIERAAGAAEVFFYYAGHGSALPDNNGDETDRRDETLFLYDSQPRERPEDGLFYNQLRDDEFNGLLAELYAKNKNLTVILDSCHSGSATRDLGEEKARFVESGAASGEAAPPAAPPEKSSFPEFSPDIMPDAVVLSASRDSELAKETIHGGKFTKALLDILGRPDAAKITYDQLMARVAGAMAGTVNRQNPVLSGNGRRFVFSGDVAYQPRFDWVAAPNGAGKVKIRGVPTIGMGPGAEFLILPGSMTAEQAKKPESVKARMRATTQLSGFEWALEPINAQQNVASIRAGDFAQLVRASDQARRLKLRLRPASEAGGIANPGAFAELMRDPFKYELGEGAVGSKVTFETGAFDFEIARASTRALQVFDRDGVLRNTLPPPTAGGEDERRGLARLLTNHFQQMTLLTDWKPSGGQLKPNESIAVSLVPYTKGDRVTAPDCVGRPVVTRTDWAGPANKLQKIPVCAYYQIRVKLDAASPISLRLGASVFSADGNMFAYPKKKDDYRVVDTNGVELKPGEQAVLNGVLQADAASIGKPERVYVLGLPPTAQGTEGAYTIPWHLLSTVRTRSPTTDKVNEREYGTYSIIELRTVEE
jgi:hypothetical protein